MSDQTTTASAALDAVTQARKLLFTLESAISLLTILVTVSRAINMLP